jgi:hypothetical protein
MLASLAGVTTAQQDCGHEAQAVSKELYDLLREAQEMIESEEYDEIESTALPFTSASSIECMELAARIYSDPRLLVGSLKACGERHPARLNCDEMQSSTGSADRKGMEEVSAFVIDLVASIESEFNCVIEISSIEEISDAYRYAGNYSSTFRATGDHCAEASNAFIARGKQKGFVFIRRDERKSQGHRDQEAILDLIHEVNPPTEN